MRIVLAELESIVKFWGEDAPYSPREAFKLMHHDDGVPVAYLFVWWRRATRYPQLSG